VRIWKTAQTGDDIARRRYCELAGNESGLLAYYKFNQGTGGGTNTGVTSLTDATANAYTGTLANFALTGSGSNWLATPASPVLNGSTIPAAPSSSAQTFCSGATVASLIPARSTTINWYSYPAGGVPLTGATVLSAGTYYVTAVNANGCESGRTPVTINLNTISTSAVSSQTVCNNTATVAITFSATTTGAGTVCGIAAENGSITLTAPAGNVFTSIPFASYGTPTGSCGSFATGSCNDVNSVSKVAAVALGQNSVTIPATNTFFSDPCGGTTKTLAVQAAYSPVITYNWTNNNTSIGLAASGTGNSIPAFTATNSTASPIVATITFTATANGCSSTSRTFTITVNPTAATPSSSVQSFCTSATVAGLLPATGTYTSWYNVASGGTALPTSTALSTGVYYVAASNAYGCGITRVAVPVNITVVPSFSVSNQTICNNTATSLITFTSAASGTVCGTATENSNVTLTAPAGTVFTSIPFASYGTPSGSCGSFSIGSCHQANSVTKVAALTLGQTSATIPAANTYFTDPCVGPAKSLYVQAAYAPPVFNWTNNNTSIGLAASGTGSTIPSFTATNSTASPIVATITVTATANGCTSTAQTFTITVNPTAPLTVVSPVYYSIGATASALTATGSSLLWYPAATGGTGSGTAPIPSTVSTGTTSYWVSANNAYNCQSARAQIDVIVAVPAKGLNFDAVGNNYIYIPSIPSLTDFSLEYWIKLTGNGQGGTYDRITSTNSDAFETAIGNSGNILFYNSVSNWITATNIGTNTWAHMAFVRKGNTLRVFKNGVFLNSYTVSTSAIPSGWDIGRRLNVSSTENPNISMDETRIWNRALCQAEIQNNMNAVLNPTGQTGLVALYHFDQGYVGISNTSVTTLTDATGNGNTGTLNNFVLTGTASNWIAGTVAGSGTTYIPATLAGSAGSTVSQLTTVNALGTFYQDAVNCGVITKVVPSGASPVTGNITAKVTIDATVQSFKGAPYVQRHFDIEPAAGAATATATVTLYYLQSEFTAYNTARGTQPALPTSSADASGIANLRITQCHGTGTAPGNYTGTTVIINPSSVGTVVWNATLSRWEVTMPVNGFSGFFAHTSSTNSALPLTLIRFSAAKTTDGVLVNWQTSNEQNASHFEIERSTNAINFEKAGTVTAYNTSGINNYQFTDNAAWVSKLRYYRLKSVDNDGAFKYSAVVIVTNKQGGTVTLYPNPATDVFTISATDNKLLHTQALLTDANGKTVKSIAISNLQQTVSVAGMPGGIYLLRLANGTVVKLIKE